MTLVYNGFEMNAIINNQGELLVCDEELHIYSRIAIDDPFTTWVDVIKTITKGILARYKNMKYKQFLVLELKTFVQSDFLKEIKEEGKKYE